MNKIKAALVAAVSAALLAGIATPAAADAPPPAHPALINAQASLLWDNYSDTQRVRLLDRMRAAGMDSFRMDLSWRSLQPYNSWTWNRARLAQLDKVVGLANRRGMKPLVTFWLTPKWETGADDERRPPRSGAAYAAALEVLAARYKGRVLGWQVWNEPNLHSFMRGADPGTYTRFLCASYRAIKRADRSALVVTGATSNVDTAWLVRMYDQGARGCFDVMALHPYMGPTDAPPTLPDDGTVYRMDHLRTVRSLMVARGDAAKPIWFTEFGWSTSVTPRNAPGYARGVNEATQATYLTQTAQLIRSRWPYVTRTYAYTIQDTHAQRPEQTDFFNSFGLIRANGVAKPALAAVRTANG